MDVIYLDHAATTPLDPKVLRSTLPFFDYGLCEPTQSAFTGTAVHRICLLGFLRPLFIFKMLIFF